MLCRSNAFSNTSQLVIQNNVAGGNPTIGPLKGNLWILLYKVDVLTPSNSPRRIDADCQSLVDERGPCAPGDGCTSSGQADESVPPYHNVVLWCLTWGSSGKTSCWIHGVIVQGSNSVHEIWKIHPLWTWSVRLSQFLVTNVGCCWCS